MIDDYTVNYRIGTSQQDLERGNFFVRGFPPPKVSIYSDAASSFEVADGGQSRHGYKKVKIMWRNMTARQYSILRNIVEESQSIGDLYMTIDKSWSGQGDRGSWVDVIGKAKIPDGNQMNGAFGFTDVVLEVNNITVINDPASNL